jgi:hypothetical protein
VRPSDQEIAALGLDFKRDWDNDFKGFPTKPLMLCGVVNAFLVRTIGFLKFSVPRFRDTLA